MNKKYFSIVFSLLVVFSFAGSVLAADETLIRNNLLQTIINLLINGGKAELTSSITICGAPINYAGKTYNTVLIGSQCWLKENLNVGTMVVGSNNQGSSCSSIQKYCYSNDENICSSDGGLYQWDQAMCGSTVPGVQGICPSGWHIPTHDEWTTLERAVCVSGTCVTDFPYDTTTTGWRGTDEGLKLNDSGSNGFAALLAGDRNSVGYFFNRPTNGYYWSSSSTGTTVWQRFLLSGGAIFRAPEYKSYGVSVRCLKDSNTLINGVCGTANKTYLLDATSYGVDTFCASGTASPVSPVFPDQGASVSWTCNGINGGSSSTCTASRSKDYSLFKAREIVEDNLPTSITFWTEAYCPTSSAFPYVVPTGYRVESCESGPVGSHGGCSYCAMSKIKLVAGINSINGVCGSANGTTVSSIPAFNFCSSGTASAIIGSGPWTWTCAGINGGTTATCSTNIITNQNFVIKILSPKAGELLQQGSIYTLSYTSSGYDSGADFSVYLSGNNNLYRPLGTLYIGKTFSFTVPTDLSGSGYQIDIAGEAITDVFSIVKPISSSYSQFKATEIVEDNLPTSITFWSEAYCPTSSSFPYIVPDGYRAESCVSGFVGSHGGCSYCAMSKIKLVQSSLAKINGTCGSATNQALIVFDTSNPNLCSSGYPVFNGFGKNSYTLSGFVIGTNFSWICKGQNGGTDYGCNSGNPCGSSAGKISLSVPTSNLCANGIPSVVKYNDNLIIDSITFNNIYSWTCGSGSPINTCYAYAPTDTNSTIKLLFPNEGENLAVGNTYNIEWESKNIDKVMIQLDKISTSVGWHLTYDTPASLGKFSFKIEDAYGLGNGDYKISIWDPNNASVMDSSDKYFSITSDNSVPSLNYSISSNNPAPYNVLVGSSNNSFLSFKLVANSLSDFNVSAIKIRRTGGANNDFGLIKLIDSEVLVGSASLDSSNIATFSIFPNIKITKGTQRVFTVTADISPTATIGDEVGLEVYLVSAKSDLVGFSDQVRGLAVSNLMTINSVQCSQAYYPVCGVNGKTYSNECLANASGITKSYIGECRTITNNFPEPSKPLNQMNRDELLNYLIKLILVLLGKQGISTTNIGL